MAEFFEAAKAGEIPPGTAVVVEVNGVEIALVNVNGEFHAVSNECTHAGGPVGEGDLVEEYGLECPLHGSVFDVRTGEALTGPADAPLETFDTKVEDGIVKIAVE